MKKHIGIFAICAVLLPHAVMGQHGAAPEKPAWVDGYFYEADNSYIESVSATGPTEDEARNKAAAVAIERRSLSTGKRVQVRVSGNSVVVDGKDELTVKARVLDEYRERYAPGEYRVSLLVQTAKNPNLQLERVNVTPDYGFSARAFVPGMAQLYKGSKAKGFLFIAGEVAMIGGVVIAESMRASYTSKINTTHSAADKKTYISSADNMQNVRNVFIAGAAALYAWNVIDGIVAKGKKHVIVLGDANLRIAPYATPEAGGVMFALNF
ncbi:MAG: hypothetical protein LBK47_08225 [Prevotellaceae bacterium]|jgi:hypothetical protein|nr:hypothetical protein [Prevotellaceae bacterium]